MTARSVSSSGPGRTPSIAAEDQLALLDSLPVAQGASGHFGVCAQRVLGEPLRATGIQVLQLNLGKLCNQTCRHCHVDAGPHRTEVMSRETADQALALLASSSIPSVDLTGGAPELCPEFEYLVRESKALGRHVMDRCNLTILSLPRFQHLPRFFADHGVEVVCSLPHYRQQATDRQRGEGVFEASIEGLKRLNEVGYGSGGDLRLVLVTNPVGAFLPAGQLSLEREWRQELQRLYGISMDELHCITNMPISRYLEWLESSGNLQPYFDQLVGQFNPDAVAGVMCRTTLSVGWDGSLFDCDFNQMLELGLVDGLPRHLSEASPELLETRVIETRRHCFGCTAGSGSSCGGQLIES